jgi:hypothetical protein
MEPSRQEDIFNELSETLQDMRRALDRLGSGNGHAKSDSRVVVNAGGIGVLVCSVLASFAVAVAFAISLWTLNLARQVGDLNSYLQAIYVQAPQLKPEHAYVHPDHPEPAQKAQR